jgi:5S rRNA maturation endonuclease (ribonuclease M5)
MSVTLKGKSSIFLLYMWLLLAQKKTLNRATIIIEGSKDRQNITDFCVMQTLLVLRRHVSAFVGHLQVSKLEEK